MQASTNYPQIEYAEKDGSVWYKTPKTENLMIMMNPELFFAMVESYNMDTLRYYRSRYLICTKAGVQFDANTIAVKCIDGRTFIVNNDQMLANMSNPRLFVNQETYNNKVFDSNRKKKVKPAVASPLTFNPSLTYAATPPAPSVVSVPNIFDPSKAGMTMATAPIPSFVPSTTSTFVLPIGIPPSNPVEVSESIEEIEDEE